MSAAVQMRLLRASSPTVLFTSWSPRGDRLLSITNEEMQVFDPHSGSEISSVRTRIGAKAAPAWSPDGKTLGAFSAVQADAVLWNVDTGDSRFLNTTKKVTALAWKPDGTLLAIGLADGTIELRDPVPGETRAATRCGNFIDKLAWSACGRWLASVGFMESTVCVWDSKTRSETTVGGHRRPVIAIAWSPANTLLASGGYDGKVRLWKPGFHEESDGSQK